MKHVYEKLHADRYTHVEQARRAREMQAELATAHEACQWASELLLGVRDDHAALRAELAAERERVTEMAKMIAEARSRPDALRADKAEAERDALRELLREVRGYFRDEWAIAARIDAKLGGENGNR